MDAPVKAGDIIDGRYRLERIIGTGGMAVVVAAIDIEQSERVALKFLFKKAAKHKEILQRFEREKTVIGRLEGEHVARMLGAGVVKSTPYMVMEYLQGRDLSKVLLVQKTLPVDQAAKYLLQACDAVAEAHGLDIVHRDLKPGNLFLTHRADGSPCIKVLDFGIAKILGDAGKEEGSLTRTEVMMGSPHYMSPEQMVSAKDATTATDIWALGVVLHELITGKLPFAERSTERLCARVLNGDPTPLREDCPSCPEGLETVILRCLKRMPEERFADVGQFAAALAPFAPKAAQKLVARIRFRLKNPDVTPPDIDDEPELILLPHPEDAPDAPTIYLQKPSRFQWKYVIFGAFGLAMAGLGFAGGLVFRHQPHDTISNAPEATTAASSSSSTATLPTAKPSLDTESEEDDEVLVPIEIDLDDGIPKPEPKRTVPPSPVSVKTKEAGEQTPTSPPTSTSTPASTPTSPPIPTPIPRPSDATPESTTPAPLASPPASPTIDLPSPF